jgi:3-deoxy-D-manno-octulosonic-acid transferase
VAGYRRFGPDLRTLLAGVEAVLCQSNEDAERWRTIGARAERVRVTGNLKFDALAPPEPDRAAARAALGLDPGRPALTLGSLRPGEARALARAWSALDPGLRERWQVIAGPRHARAAAELLEEAGRHGVSAARDGMPQGSAWRWDARPGVLSAYYGASEVAFVGASLVPLGGHNPLEPAARGVAVLMGPHGSHQGAAVERLRAHRAIVIAGTSELAPALARLLGEAAARDSLVTGGLRAVATLRGAASRTARELEALGLWPSAP